MQGTQNQGMQSMPGMQGMPFKATGTIEIIEPRRVKFADASGIERIITLNQQTTVKTTGEATDEFLKAVEADGDWDLTWRTKPGKVADTVKARCLQPDGSYRRATPPRGGQPCRRQAGGADVVGGRAQPP